MHDISKDHTAIQQAATAFDDGVLRLDRRSGRRRARKASIIRLQTDTAIALSAKNARITRQGSRYKEAHGTSVSRYGKLEDDGRNCTRII